ncbi:hypothetical protein McanCB56680_001832 [Microsporum canis]
MAVLHARLQLSLHKHHKREVEHSTRLVLIACSCALLVVSIFLLFYRARSRADRAAPAQLHPNIQLQRQNIAPQYGVPQHVGDTVASNPYPSQSIPPARLGLRRDDDQFNTPAPPYYPHESQTKPGSAPYPQTQTPPPTYLPSAQKDHQPDGRAHQN